MHTRRRTVESFSTYDVRIRGTLTFICKSFGVIFNLFGYNVTQTYIFPRACRELGNRANGVGIYIYSTYTLHILAQSYFLHFYYHTTRQSRVQNEVSDMNIHRARNIVCRILLLNCVRDRVSSQKKGSFHLQYTKKNLGIC